MATKDGDIADTIATLDAESAVAEAERLAGDADARDAFVRRVNDAALAFLLRHLPAMPVPDIDVEQNGVSYPADRAETSVLALLLRFKRTAPSGANAVLVRPRSGRRRRYLIENLSLSNLRISEDDVTVEVATASGGKVQRKGVGIRGGPAEDGEATPLDADPAARVRAGTECAFEMRVRSATW